MRVEVFEDQGDEPLFFGTFDASPRVGDKISKDAGGYFQYFEVVDLWHRCVDSSERFELCISVRAVE